MKESPLVSIIVPVYNVAGYLRQCLDSIVHQTYLNIEVLLVNDGSTDKSGEICDEYAKHDNRIIVIHKENGGASSARNLGIENAHGDYVYFADSDDYLEQNAIQTLVLKAEQDNIDCIYFAAQNFVESDAISVKKNSLLFHSNYSISDGKELIPKLIKNKDYHAAPFQYFIRRNILYDIRFEESIMFEDELFSFQILQKCQTVLCHNQILYKRRVHEGSVMTSKGKGKFRFHSISVVLERLCDIYKNDSSKVVKAYLERIGVLWFTRYDELSKEEKANVEQEFERLLAIIEEEKYFESTQLLVRRYGFIPWFLYNKIIGYLFV